MPESRHNTSNPLRLAKILLLALALGGSAAAQDSELGLALYEGKVGIAATLRGHAQPLPSGLSRCISCHEPSREPTQGQAIFAMRLDKKSLTEASKRRGGPPTRYERASFCRTLRTGIDPAEVLLHKSMPLFVLSEEQCTALWDHLSQRTPIEP
jgi:hypothetical protein